MLTLENKENRPEAFTGEFYQMFKKNNTKLHRGGNIPNSFIEGSIILIPKQDKFIRRKP